MLFVSLLCTAATASAPKPNVIILFADDMGYSQPSAVSDRSGYAGANGTIATPNLDKLASESVVFTSWYSSFHCCTASRASMMTGRLSVRTGIGFVGGGSNGVFTAESIGSLPLNETTLAEAVQPAGYKTGMIGKWHLGQAPHHLPPSRGFDYYFGIPFSCDMGLSAWRYSNHSEQPFQARPLPLFNCSDGAFCDDSKVVEQPTNLGTLTMRYANAALDFIAEAHAAATPFLLYAPFNHVHAPNFAAVNFCNTSTHGPVGDATQEFDHAVGVMSKGVLELGIDENTVWFFTSDNGAPISNDAHGNGPLRDGKMTTWEGGIREPAFVRWKGTFEPRTTDSLAATYDIYATVLALTGVSPPTDRVLDGKDLTPLLQSESAPAAHRCLIHYWSPQIANSDTYGNTSGVAAVRCGSYKAHYYVRNTGAGGNHEKTKVSQGPHSPPVLFNLDTDISESNPIAVSSSNPAAAAAMREIDAALAAHLETVDMVPNQMIAANNPCKHSGTAATTCVGGNDLNQAVCKDPNSKAKYPTFANCTSNPENFGTADCRAANPKCIAKCLSTEV